MANTDFIAPRKGLTGGSINLLPPELVIGKQQSARLALVNRMSVIALVALLLTTSTTFTLRFLERSNIQKVNSNLALAENKIDTLKTKESYAVALKKRLSSIESLSAQAPKVNMFNFIVGLLPAASQVSLLSVDKSSNVTISISTSTLADLDNVIKTLLDPDKNLGLIQKVDVEGMSKGKDGIYRVSLKIAAKQ